MLESIHMGRKNAFEETARRQNALRRAAPTAKPPQANACPHCASTTASDAEESSGSSSMWFACKACGFRWRLVRNKK